MFKKKLGAIGEQKACEYLKKKGYKIVKRNFKCSGGEIDVIAKKKEVIHFVEVKTRSNDDYDSAINSLDEHKMQHIARASECFLETYHKHYETCQIDACLVLFKDEQSPTIHLLENIYEG